MAHLWEKHEQLRPSTESIRHQNYAGHTTDRGYDCSIEFNSSVNQFFTPISWLV
jgi:hypothetical protein